MLKNPQPNRVIPFIIWATSPMVRSQFRRYPPLRQSVRGLLERTAEPAPAKLKIRRFGRKASAKENSGLPTDGIAAAFRIWYRPQTLFPTGPQGALRHGRLSGDQEDRSGFLSGT